MWTAVEKLLDKGISTLLAFVGAVLICCAFLEFARSGDHWSVRFVPSPTLFAFVTGGIFVAGGVALYWLENFSGAGIARHKVVKCGNGYSVTVGEPSRAVKIAVVFGKIDEQPLPQKPTEAFILPANEFFDQECFSDPRAALGSFALRHFPGADFQKLLACLAARIASDSVPSTPQEKEKGVTAPRYEIGTSLLLDTHVHAPIRLIVTAVSTKRPGQGIHCELGYLYSAIPKIQSVLVDHQIDTVTLPLLGSGKGGVGAELSLFTLVVGLLDASRRTGGHNLRSITLVIYQASPKENPHIPKQIVRRILSVGAAMVK
jgi:hypothetical protein